MGFWRCLSVHEIQRQHKHQHFCRLQQHTRLGLDALHNALNRTLAEVIAVALHGQTINTNRYLFLLQIRADDDAARIQIVIQSLRFTQEYIFCFSFLFSALDVWFIAVTIL